MSKYTRILEVPIVGLRRYIKKGDKNEYVGQWQDFLNWWSDGEFYKECGGRDDTFGQNTYDWSVKFQTEQFSEKEADGKVGKLTINKAKVYEKQDGKKNYTGPFPDIHVKKTSAEAIADGLAWAKIVCADNRFHYGEGGNRVKDFGDDVYKITHQSGCHFCDTNKRKKVNKIKKLKRSDLIATNWEYTYVCNVFVTAILAHGFLDPTILKYCIKGSCVGMNSAGKAVKLDSNKNFECLGHIPLSEIKKGDILVKSSHMNMCYAPINSKKCKITEATSYIGKYGNAASKNSVRIIEKQPVYTNVYRFVGKVDADIVMRCGEYGKRVGDWQDFLNWWSDGAFYKECGGRDNMFGDNTKKWTIKFQEKEIGKGKGDGLIGNKTIAKAKEIKK